MFDVMSAIVLGRMDARLVGQTMSVESEKPLGRYSDLGDTT